eukprot:2415744-Amphidinium_carterae.1
MYITTSRDLNLEFHKKRAMTTPRSSTCAMGCLEDSPHHAMMSAGTGSLKYSVSFVLQSINTPPMMALPVNTATLGDGS